jgi:GTP-binding protein
MILPTVAIVGRPNVGKSSLFNRILQKKLAVVDGQPGVTRDRNYAIGDWNGIEFRLVDTGGIVPEATDLMESMIYDQTDFAINESDVVILVVDTQVGIDPVDREIARRLNKSGKACVVTANKADNEILQNDIYDFMKLGLGEPMPVSATIGRGVGDLLDQVVELLPPLEEPSDAESNVIRVALVGRPNTGKSSFINKLIGQQRHIVTPIAGTTRDAIDTPFESEGQKYVLVDTAGLRRKYKVRENVEFYTNLRTTRAIDSCDVAVVLTDASDGLTMQDQHVLQQVMDNRRPAVLAVNKWDLVEKDSYTADKYTLEINDVLAKYSFLPVIYISALSGQRVPKVLAMVKTVHAENNKRIGTSELNEFLLEQIARKHPPSKQGKHIKIKYVTQSEVAPPTFLFFSNHPTLISKSYISYLGNRIRRQFGFEGVPIRLKFRKK